MGNFLKIAAFALFTVACFAGYSNFGIPQIKPAPPPVEEKLDLSSMTMDQFIVVGETIFNGKGTCTLCHNDVGGRAPMLGNMPAISIDRLKDPRYKGEAKNAEEFILESLLKPSAFVVAGFGKAGTKDSESPMPDVSSGAIGLSEAETAAVVAYLQDLGGAEVTVEIPKVQEGEDADSGAGSVAATGEGGKRALYANGEEVAIKLNCGMCHKIAGQSGALGPDLTNIGAKFDKDYLRRAIIDPNADVAEGFPPIMPAVYGEQLYAAELEMLVDYLAGLK